MKLQDTTTIYSCVAMCSQGVYCMQTLRRKCFTIWWGMHFKLIWGTLWRKPTMEHTSSLKNISPNKYVLEFIPEVFILCVVVKKKAHRSILIKCFVCMQRYSELLFYFIWGCGAGWCGDIVFKVCDLAFCFILLTFLLKGRKNSEQIFVIWGVIQKNILPTNFEKLMSVLELWSK